MSNSSVLTKEQFAQAHIDERILQLERTIVQLKGERNRYSSIAKLPPEVLGIIFTIASTASYYKFSWVSRHWRIVALSTPRIWTNIDGYKDWSRLKLQRSKNAELDFTSLNIKFDSDKGKAFREVISKHMSRIRSMCISFQSTSDGQRGLDILPASAPCLQTLRIRCQIPPAAPESNMPKLLPSSFVDANLVDRKSVV